MKPHHARFLARTTPSFRYPSWTYYTYDFACAAWSPDGQVIAVGGLSGCLVALSREGDEVWRTSSVYSKKPGARQRSGELWADIRCLAFSQDGAHVVVGTFDDQVILFDATDGTKLGAWSGRTSTVEIFAVGFSPDGTQIAATSSKGRLYHWTTEALAAGEKPTWTVGLSAMARALRWSSDSERVILACSDGVLRAREIARRRADIVLCEGLAAPRDFIQRDGEVCLVSSRGVYRFDAAWEPSLIFDGEPVHACFAGEDLDHIACFESSGEVAIYDGAGEEVDRWRMARYAGASSRVVSSPDGAILAMIHGSTEVTLARADDLGRAPLEVAASTQDAGALRDLLPTPLRADCTSWMRSGWLGWEDVGEVVWSSPLAREQRERFIADEDHVYLWAAGEPVGALRREDGEPAWLGVQIRPRGGSQGQAAAGWIGGERVVMAGNGLICFTPDGRERWRAHLGGLASENASQYLVDLGGEAAWCPTFLHARVAFSLRDGACLWGSSKGLHAGCGVAVSEHHYFHIDQHGELVKNAHGEDAPEWSVKTRASSGSAPIWCGEEHLILTGYGSVECVSARDGEQLWSARVSSVLQTHVIDDRILVVLTSYGEVIAMSALDGEVLWSLDALPEAQREPKSSMLLTFSPDEILVPRHDRVCVVDPETGHTWVDQPLGERRITAPLVAADGVLYVACKGELLAIAPAAWSAPRAPAPGSLAASEPAPWQVRPPRHRGVYLRAVDAYGLLLEDATSLTARSIEDGSCRWRVARGNVNYSGMVSADAREVFLIVNLDFNVAELVCLARASGEPRWKRPVLGSYEPKVLGHDEDHVYVSEEAAICVYSRVDGALRDRIEDRVDKYRPRIALVEESVVSCHNGHLARHRADGALVWEDVFEGTVRAHTTTHFVVCGPKSAQVRRVEDGEVLLEVDLEEEAYCAKIVGESVFLVSKVTVIRADLARGVVWSHEHEHGTPKFVDVSRESVALSFYERASIIWRSREDGEVMREDHFSSVVNDAALFEGYLLLALASGEILSCLPGEAPALAIEDRAPAAFSARAPESLPAHPTSSAPRGEWLYPLGSIALVDGALMLNSRVCVISSMDNGIIALDACTGRRVWAHDSGIKALALALVEGDVWARMEGGKIIAISPEGEERWGVDIPDVVASWWVFGDGALALTKRGHGFFIDADGALVARVSYGGALGDAPPTVDLARGLVFLHAHNQIRALGLYDGEERWRRDVALESCAQGGGAIVGDTLVISGRSALVHGLGVEDGEVRWSQRIEGVNMAEGRPVVVGEDVIVATYSYSKTSLGDALVRLRASDGAEVWRHRTAGGSQISPALTTRTVLCFDDQNEARAVELKGGELSWKREACPGLYSPRYVLAHDRGVVLVGTDLVQGLVWPQA